MINVKKIENFNGYDSFFIENDSGKFIIGFLDNLDLYFSYIYSGNISEVSNINEIVITKENYFIYSLFDEVYDAIKSKNPFKYCDVLSDRKNVICDDYKHGLLFNNDIVKWCSDDAIMNYASSISIKKYDNYYGLVFEKSKDNDKDLLSVFPTFSVRINNNGSRYQPYNCAFMNLYNKLCNYDFGDKQIHFEEYLYEDNIRKRKRF